MELGKREVGKTQRRTSLMVRNSGEDKCFQKWYENSIEHSTCAVLRR